MQQDGTPNTNRVTRNARRKDAQHKRKMKEEQREKEKSVQEATNWMAALGVPAEKEEDWKPEIPSPQALPSLPTAGKRGRREWKTWEEEEDEEKRAAAESSKIDVGVVSDAVAGELPPARDVRKAIGPSTRGAARAGSTPTHGEMRTPSSRPRDITPLSPAVRDGQQLEADAEDSVAKLQRKLDTQLAENKALYESLAKLTREKDDANHEVAKLQHAEQCLLTLNGNIDGDNYKLTKQLEESYLATEQFQTEIAVLKKRDEVQNNVIKTLKTESKKLLGDLEDAVNGKHAAETANDSHEVMKTHLHKRIDALEEETKELQDVAGDNARLKTEIETVHTSLEAVFSDMAKDLTIDEQLEYLRDQQNIAPIGQEQPDNNTSLHEEIGDALDNVTEHADNSTQTDDVATTNYADKSTDTAATINKELANSSFQTVATTQYADKSTETAATINEELVNRSTQTDATEPEVIIREITKIKRVVHQTAVHVPFTPWWMWVLFIVGIFACFAAFAALWRERQIWVVANDLAYQRLVGGGEEGWVGWVRLGVEEVVLGGGWLGASLLRG